MAFSFVRGAPRFGFQRTPFRFIHPSRTCQSTRSFSAATNERNGIVDVLVSVPDAILSAFHASPLIPWCVALPATAIFARGVLGYYLSTRPNRMRAIKRQVAVPLAQAIMVYHLVHKPKKFYSHLSVRTSDERSVTTMVRRWWAGTRVLDKLGRRYGAGLVHWSSFVNIAIFLSFMEAIRLKCGTGTGLLSLLLTPLRWFRGTEQELVSGSTASTSLSQIGDDHGTALGSTPDELYAQRLEAILEAKKAALTSNEALPTNIDGSQLLSEMTSLSAQAQPITSHFDPTLQTEGFAWCTDLTIPDPYFVLPVLFFASLSANILLTQVQVPAPGRVADARLETGLKFRQRVGMTVAVFLSVASTQAPAGLLVYWIPSILVGWLQGRWLNIKYPVPKPIVRCKKPLRNKHDKVWT